ncbi:MAG TPA: hypothetical protein VF292_15340 [Rhodanobacteraceae bacterium]
MSEGELYGLLVIAREQQEAAEKQAQAATEAVETLTRAVAGIPRAAQEAARFAFNEVDQELHGSVGEACRMLRNAADDTRHATRAVAWWELAAAFLLGAVVVGVVAFMTMGPQLDRIEQSALASCQQLRPAPPAAASAQQH